MEFLGIILVVRKGSGYLHLTTTTKVPKVLEFLEDERSEGRPVPEEGAYSIVKN